MKRRCSCGIRRQDLLFHREEHSQQNSITLVLKTDVPSQIISPTSLLYTNSHQFKYGGYNVRRELERALWREREEKACMGMCILLELQESNKNTSEEETKKYIRERGLPSAARRNQPPIITTAAHGPLLPHRCISMARRPERGDY